jgi:hypothetical protein
MKHFFVSYNRADKAAAEWIAWQLESAGYSVVIQAWDFRPGSNFVLDMQRGLEDCERVLAVLSPDYLSSKFTAPEWAVALANDPTGVKGLLVTVRVRPCEVKALLAQVVYVDLVGLTSEQAMRQALLAGIDRTRAKPATPPPAPDTGAAVATPERLVRGELIPDPQHRPPGPKPQWETAFDFAVEQASGAFWRLLRAVAIVVVSAVALLQVLKTLLPEAAASEDGRQLAVIAGVLGLLTMLVVEAGLRWWRRRGAP